MALAMEKHDKLQLIRDTAVIAIMRAASAERLLSAAEAIRAGGVRVIEVTMTTPGALELIGQANSRFGDDVLFGAGSVLDTETARAAILAGAGFIVAPTLNLEVIRLGNRYSVPVLPGCYTPSEALAGWEAGGSMIKLFSAGVGGPALVKALLAPLPQLEIVPVGGVDLDNARAYMAAGATAVGIGNSLVSEALLDAGDLPELTRRAAALIARVATEKRL